MKKGELVEQLISRVRGVINEATVKFTDSEQLGCEIATEVLDWVKSEFDMRLEELHREEEDG